MPPRTRGCGAARRALNTSGVQLAVLIASRKWARARARSERCSPPGLVRASARWPAAESRFSLASCLLPMLNLARTSRTSLTRSLNWFGVGLRGGLPPMRAARSAVKQSSSAAKVSALSEQQSSGSPCQRSSRIERMSVGAAGGAAHSRIASAACTSRSARPAALDVDVVRAVEGTHEVLVVDAVGGSPGVAGAFVVVRHDSITSNPRSSSSSTFFLSTRVRFI